MNVAAIALAGLLHEIGRLVPNGKKQFLGTLGKSTDQAVDLAQPPAASTGSAPDSPGQAADSLTLSLEFVRNLPFLPAEIDRHELEELVEAYHRDESPREQSG